MFQDHYENKYSRIATSIRINQSVDLADEIRKLNEMIGIPNGLAQMGVTEDMIPKLVKHSIIDPSNLTIPRLPNQEMWEKLFLESM
ncbi:iron-containing alcohol dehydrogenase [Gammaproteobacteria bacterium]|nr:iron-containing alcohol dehydrogenase [Gammaproteobacteria bacterium]